MPRALREWWLAIQGIFLLIGISSAAICPPSDTILPCRCSNIGEDTQIWCSYSSLPSVMGAVQRLAGSLHTTVDEMILEGNNLPSLPGRNFEGLQIVRLMMRDNGLERVTSNWLATLEPVLQELFIIEPRMRTLPPDLLELLHNLEAVTLQVGLMKRAPRFVRLPKLRYIQIMSPILTELSSESFQDLPNLEQINVVGSPLLNKLEAGLFRDLVKLNLINISNCSVSWLHPKTFFNLNNVKEVSLMWNRISDAAVVGRATRELRSLQILRLDNNFIDRLIENSFVDLLSLRELYLSGNMISEIHSGAFRNTPSLKILDLNKNLLRRVNAAAFMYPAGSALEELWLIDNQLYQVNELRALFNSLPRLRFLDMSKNEMEELPFDVLRGHATLERLHLNENRIKRLPKKAFAGMASLRELRLRNNSISDYPDGAAWNLPSLKGLDLSQNKIRRLDARLMTYLPSLRRLDLSENFIDIVLPDSFIGNLNLETINLSKNFITSFHALTFGHLPKLYELDASYNRLREVIQGLPKDIEYLRLGQNQIFTLPAPPGELQLPHLRLLDLNGNALQILQQDTFQSMSKLQLLYLHNNLLQGIEKDALRGLSRLQILNLRNNRIRDINGNYLKDLKQLKELNLEGNQLEIISRGISEYSPKLEIVNLGRNKISEIQPGAFSNARELQHINATQNYLDRFPAALQGLKMLRTLDVSHNHVRSVQPYLFERLPSLTELHMANNKLYDLPSRVFNDLQKLEFLDLENNELENLSHSSLSSLPSLIALQLGGNRLTSIQDETFIDLPELQSLDLQSNNLQSISERAFVNTPHLTMLNLSHNLLLDMDKAGLRQLRSLEVLDLSDNRVGAIDGSNFKGMDWLVELKMDHNIICQIHGAPFNDLPRLRVLSLRHNRMTSVSETAFQQLRNNVALLDIDGNPLSCSCGMLWLQSWLQDSTAAGPHCRDGTLFRDARLSRTDCANSRIIEPVVPGCEEQAKRHHPMEVVSLNLRNDSSAVVLPQSMNLKVPNSPEPEYVYDEYMEYEEVNGTDATPTFVPVDVTAGEMKASPHLISGDTPTLYAQQKPPKLNLTNPGLGYDDLKKAQQLQAPGGGGGYNGLSFFGIPLPNFSIGNIWKGRSSDTGYKKGRVQPVNPTGRNRVPNFVTLGPPEEEKPAKEPLSPAQETYPPYVTPSSLETGFRPMVGNPEEVDEIYRDISEYSNPTNTLQVPQLPLEPKRDATHFEVAEKAHLSLDVPSPSPHASEDIPSATLPREHRTEDEAPAMPPGAAKNEEQFAKVVPRPGRVEPVIQPKQKPESEMLIPPVHQPNLDFSASEEDLPSPHQFDQLTKHKNSEDFPISGKANDISLYQQSEPKANNYVSNAADSWYFQNYNKTDIQPFVERSYTNSNAAPQSLSSAALNIISVISLYVACIKTS